ncbi:MAG: 23S rRNA (pseudouridine(1915)-N(3))-methyltransferase RlmH [Flavobacteriales bacterium]|nr:23S rRNA (pseudouridine(1915)-N(3))-methyltransferase RlmH [Flavobacteriales bacterium]|tara:strand:+ start:514 stop:987 length:474 start_codon:yes stop_codon:yes gene_type:complete
MKIVIVSIGKTNQNQIKDLIYDYYTRINFYHNLEMVELDRPKFSRNLSDREIVRNESELLMQKTTSSDFIILLDEKGKTFTTKDFTFNLQKWFCTGKKRLVFIIGGPFGFDKAFMSKINNCISLSKMTFSHQMAKLFFVEQLYRSFTIINNNPYHHE